MYLNCLSWSLVLAPLIGSLVIGLDAKHCNRLSAQLVASGSVAISFVLSISFLIWQALIKHPIAWQVNGFNWSAGDYIHFSLGLCLDQMSLVMMAIVTSVSFLVHVYSISYMQDDPGYRRFFCYIAFFTFAMLMLVGADNFLQLFFGWEAVGLASYLLIGFWFDQTAANTGSLKAFLVNRIGDFGFLLGVALIFREVGSLKYTTIFEHVSILNKNSIYLFGTAYPVLEVVCMLLFIGAMAKSAQIPLHIWLPESMAGPTPVSALMHAATMVVAGIYMVARLSPLFEYAPMTRAFVLMIGASTALFMGLVAIIQTDIKRVIAFSTLSQLGYMVAALGVSAYTAAIFHLTTHAFFKALLFLAAGSVILTLRHEQDIRKMGGLWQRLPVSYVCFLLGALALVALPPFSGFYSKEAIIEAVYSAHYFGNSPSASYAFYSLLVAAFVTAVYTFRLFFLVFHGKAHYNLPANFEVRESPKLITWPLIGLAIPTVVLGKLLIGLVHEEIWLGNSVFRNYNDVSPLLASLKPPALKLVPTLIALSGVLTSVCFYVIWPQLPSKLAQYLRIFNALLQHQYGLERLSQRLLQGTQCLAQQCMRLDNKLIDQQLVQGVTQLMRCLASYCSNLQSGYLYHYLWLMVIGLIGLFVSGIVYV